MKKITLLILTTMFSLVIMSCTKPKYSHICEYNMSEWIDENTIASFLNNYYVILDKLLAICLVAPNLSALSATLSLNSPILILIPTS